ARLAAQHRPVGIRPALGLSMDMDLPLNVLVLPSIPGLHAVVLPRSYLNLCPPPATHVLLRLRRGGRIHYFPFHHGLLGTRAFPVRCRQLRYRSHSSLCSSVSSVPLCSLC